jgi:hypothetical protein
VGRDEGGCGGGEQGEQQQQPEDEAVEGGVHVFEYDEAHRQFFACRSSVEPL